jgi:hypothetical protein
VARFREYNTRGCAASFVAGLGFLLAVSSAGSADEIRKWRDPQGIIHYSVTGPKAGAPAASGKAQMIRGRDASAAERFSVTASLQRRTIESKLGAAGDDLTKARDAIREAETRQLVIYSPPPPQNPAQTQLVLDAQRNAFLAARAFENDQAEELRRLRRRERERLREIVGLWKDFAVLDAEVLKWNRVSPAWWRGRLDCGRCPTLVEAQAALKQAREALEGPESSAATMTERVR